ncbi:hypothetical protein V8F33_013882, partial [Rhypophila sp. PSN 637]
CSTYRVQPPFQLSTPVRRPALQSVPTQVSGCNTASSIDGLVHKLVDKGASNFVQLVKAIRDPQQAKQLQKFRNLPRDDANARAVVLTGIAIASQADVHVARLIHCRALVLLADTLDRTKDGRQNVDPVEFKNILAQLELDQTKENLGWIQRMYSEGKSFRPLVSLYGGLLCFLAMVNNRRLYVRLKNDKLKEFQDAISHYRHLWDAGHNLLGILEGEDKKFTFESWDTKDMSEDSLQPLLRVL